LTVLGEREITKFARRHPHARRPLARFLEALREADWHHFPDVKEAFSATDYVASSRTYVFDVGGNKYRLLASIDFDAQILIIDAILTHEQYNRKEI
jgi:mRNA interferase HigB